MIETCSRITIGFRLRALLEQGLLTSIQSYRISSSSLRAFRVAYAAYLLLVKVPTALWTAHMPQAFFLPVPGPMCFWTSYPEPWLALALNIFLAVLAAVLMLGYGGPFISLGIATALIGLDSFAFTAGRIDGTGILCWIPMTLAFSSWTPGATEQLPSGDRNVQRDSVCLFALALLVGYAMFQAGLTKALSGWLRPDSLCTFGYWVTITQGKLTNPSPNMMSAWLSSAAGPLFWKSLDYLTVGWECFFLVAVYRMSWFRVMAWTATLFHAAVGLTFGIFFNWNLLGYLVFFDIAPASATRVKHLRPLLPLVVTVLLIAAVTAATVYERSVWALLCAAWIHQAAIYSAPLFFAVLLFTRRSRG